MEFKIVIKYVYGWKEKCGNVCVDNSCQECTNFSNNYKSYLKLLDANTLTWSNFCTEDLQISGVTVITYTPPPRSGTWDLFIPDFSFSTLLVPVYLSSSSFHQLLSNCLVVEYFSLLRRLAPFRLQFAAALFITAAIHELSQNASARLPKGTSCLGLKTSTLLEVYFGLIRFNFKMKLHYWPKRIGLIIDLYPTVTKVKNISWVCLLFCVEHYFYNFCNDGLMMNS